MISCSALKAAGYKRRTHSRGEFCTGFYQKRVKDHGATLYSVEVFEWRFPGIGVNYSSSARLFLSDGTEFDCAPVLSDQWTVEGLEAWFASVYSRLGGVPNRDNN